MPTSSALANASLAFSNSDLTFDVDVLTLSFETSLGLTILSGVVAPGVSETTGGCSGVGAGAGVSAFAAFASGFGAGAADMSEAPQRRQNFLVGKFAFPHLAHVLKLSHPHSSNAATVRIKHCKGFLRGRLHYFSALIGKNPYYLHTTDASLHHAMPCCRLLMILPWPLGFHPDL